MRPHLTPREQQCLEMVADGLIKKQIATRLKCTEFTVKTHLANVYTKLGVSTQGQAVYRAVRLGLLNPGPPREHCDGCICERLGAARAQGARRAG